MLDGNIIDEDTYGSDSPPDWDGSNLADSHPRHNAQLADYTWRADNSQYAPGRLDFVLYTDSVIREAKSFVLDTQDMNSADLATHGMLRQDCADASDHLPLVVDFDFGDRALVRAAAKPSR